MRPSSARSRWSRPHRALLALQALGAEEIEPANVPYRGAKGSVVVGRGGYQMFELLAVDSGGHVYVATLITGAISDMWPDGSRGDQYW